jgi:hypothetical protein
MLEVLYRRKQRPIIFRPCIDALPLAEIDTIEEFSVFFLALEHEKGN